MYQIGQKVCLWQENIIPANERAQGSVVVVKEVIVTITDMKTGVLGYWSREPVRGTSLRGLGDDGKMYEKHWDEWPESQTSDFVGQWTSRDDGVLGNGFWIPKEAIHAHHDLKFFNKQIVKDGGTGISRVDGKGQPCAPKGDVEHCQLHDDYFYSGDSCFLCRVEARRKIA